MNTKNTNYVLVVILLIILGLGVVVYPYLPAQLASHWNIYGQVDGYMSKFWGVYLLPIISTGLCLMYWIVPNIDPHKNNIKSFRDSYNLFWVVLMLFLAYIFGLQLTWNLGFSFNFTSLMAPAFAGLWYCIGGLMQNSKRNWFVGIRTPWTLSSDQVWRKTHRLGAKLFKVSAILLLSGLVAKPVYYFWVMSLVIIISAIIPVVYSYVVFRKS